MTTEKKTTEIKENKEIKEVKEVKPIAKTEQIVAKKTRKPRVKTRTLAELKNVPYTKMTQKELILCINYLKGEIAIADSKLALLEDNVKSAYEAKRKIEEQFNNMLIKTNADIAYIQSLTATFTEAILRTTKER